MNTKINTEIKYFMESDRFEKNVTGELSGFCQFMQSHNIYPDENSTRELPRLVSSREALFIFRPDTYDQEFYIVVSDSCGDVVGKLMLNNPPLLPSADSEQRNSYDVKFIENGWSIKLPWDWVFPGMVVEVKDLLGRTGIVSAIDVGAENLLLLNNISIGMLTQPIEKNNLRDDSNLAIDYFQKIPCSTLIINNYPSVYLDKIVMPDGKIYITNSPDTGGVYDGDMREDIAKSLYAIGIDNANFGINSTAGKSQWQPQYFNQITIERVIGRYANGDIEQGLSGGGGIATLLDTIGNEFSHELGHAYGLGHYEGGGDWCIHDLNSGWGWNAVMNRMIANFYWNQNADSSYDGIVRPPFKDTYQFGYDAMAGGEASSPLSKYTHHTGYSAKRIQSNFERTGIFSPDSMTGYLIYDSGIGNMVVNNATDGRTKPQKFGIPIVTVLGFYDPRNEFTSCIYPALQANYGHTWKELTSQPEGSKCWLEVLLESSQKIFYPLDDTRLDSRYSNKLHVNIPQELKPLTACIYLTHKSSPTPVLLTSLEIILQEQQKEHSYTIGKEIGYQEAIRCSPTFTENASLKHRVYPTIEMFEADICKIYQVAEIKSWESSQVGNPGDVYWSYQNNSLHYFKLTTSHYGYYPEVPNSDKIWHYLGSENDFVNYAINPLYLDKDCQLTVEQKLLKYEGRDILFTWEQRQTTQQDREVFTYPEKGSYLLQRRAATGHYYPTDKNSNSSWIYITNLADLNSLLTMNYNQFNEYILDWFRQDAFGQWSDGGEPGRVYLYDNPYAGTKDYFVLHGDSRTYYPIDHTSAPQWEYIGSYQ